MAKVKISLPDEFSLADCRNRIGEIDLELARLDRERSPLREQLGHLDRELNRLQNEKRLLEARRAELAGRPNVSDHAVLRYLQRKYDLNVEAIREEILSPAVRRAIEAGARGVKADGGTYKISGTTVVTFFDGKS